MPQSRTQSFSKSGGVAEARAAKAGRHPATRPSGGVKGSPAAAAQDTPSNKRVASEDRQARKMLDEIKVRGEALSARINALRERVG